MYACERTLYLDNFWTIGWQQECGIPSEQDVIQRKGKHMSAIIDTNQSSYNYNLHAASSQHACFNTYQAPTIHASDSINATCS